MWNCYSLMPSAKKKYVLFNLYLAHCAFNEYHLKFNAWINII